MPRFRSKKLLIVMIVAIFSIAWFGVAKAFFNPQINYQGKLTNSSDVAVTDGTYNMQFSLCADSACSSVLWSEVRTSTNKVQVTNGLFSVMLGEVATTSLSGVDFNQDIYLELQVGGTSTPSFETLLPRKRFGSVPNAFNSAKLGGKFESQFGTLAENEIITGAWNFNNILSITANSSSPALSILQSGTGTGISVGNGVVTTTILGSGTSTFPYGATFATTGGNVGIGTLNPAYSLDVAGNIRATGQILLSNGTSTAPSLIFSSATGTGIFLSATDTIGHAFAGRTGYTEEGFDTGVSGGRGVQFKNTTWAGGTSAWIFNTTANNGNGSDNIFNVRLANSDRFYINGAGAMTTIGSSFTNYGGGNDYTFGMGNVGSFNFSGTGGIKISQTAQTFGSRNALLITSATHTGLTTLTEVSSAKFDFSSNKTWAAGAGTLAIQREFSVFAPTYNGSSTIPFTMTNASTFAISGAPIQGTGITITNPLALWVQSGKSRFDGDMSVTGSVSIGTTTLSEKLRVYDGTLLVDSPVHPTLLGSYNTTGTVYAVDVSNKYAYVADGASGLEIFEISNPANPTLIGYYDTAGEARDVKIVGKYAYVADNGDGLLVFDVSAPANPILVGSYDSPGAAIGVDISGKYAYIADITSFVTVDISNPKNPTLAAQLSTVSPIKVHVSGEYAYLAKNTGGSGGGLSVVNISNPLNPILASTTASTFNSYDVYASGRYAYLANGDNNNVLVYDVSVPTVPALSLTLSTVGSVQGVFAAGNYIYVTDTSTFYIYNAAAGGALVGSYTINDGFNLKIIGKHAYVANGTSGFDIIDIKGADISSANIGTIATNDLTVWENADFGNNISIRNGLNVGNGGILSNGAVAITVSTTISTTTLFSVGTSTPLFMVSADGSVRINTTSTSNYKLMVDSGSSTTAGIGVNGYIKASGFITGTTTLDLAETYPFDLSCVANGTCPMNGDMVCADSSLSTGVKKCSATSTESILGVVSANPGFLLGGSEFGDLQATNTSKIALSGRVPVKVNITSGTIKIGDELSVGVIDGTAQKALEPGQVIGVALENFGKENEPYPQTGTVLVFVNPHWSIGNLEAKDIPNDLPDFTTTTPSIIDKFTLAIENSLQKLGLVIKDGVAKLKELFVDKIFTKQLCVGETCIGEQQLKDILQNSQVSPTVQTAPLVNTQSFSPPAVLSDTTSSFSAITATVPVVDNTTTATIQAPSIITPTDTTTIVTSVTPSI